jgi:hypothetical protein
MATRKNKLAADFCRCIKKVRKTIKLRPGVKKTASAKEAAAIGVCVKAVLQTKGKTLKRFRCDKKTLLTTQKPLRGGSVATAGLRGGAMGAPYQSTDPTASRIQPGTGLQAYYENATKAPVQL